MSDPLGFDDPQQQHLDKAAKPIAAALFAKLLKVALKAHAWGREDVASLADSIYSMRLRAYIAAYKETAARLGISLPNDWQPANSVLKAMERESATRAKGIAATYQSDLERHIQNLRDSGTLDGLDEKAAQQAIRNDVHNWLSARADRKAQQIAANETNTATNQAADDFLGDLDSGDLSLPPGVSLDDIQVLVLPETSSNDECADWAGGVFSLEEATAIPELPMHANCPHFKLVTLAGS